MIKISISGRNVTYLNKYEWRFSINLSLKISRKKTIKSLLLNKVNYIFIPNIIGSLTTKCVFTLNCIRYGIIETIRMIFKSHTLLDGISIGKQESHGKKKKNYYFLKTKICLQKHWKSY